MNKRNVIIFSVLAFLIVGFVAIYFVFSNQPSADTLEATKGTKVQLVDINGDLVQESVPLKLKFDLGEKRVCTRARWSFKKVCKDVPYSFEKLVFTNEQGNYTVSTQSYRPLSPDEMITYADSYMLEQEGRKIYKWEKSLLYNVYKDLVNSKDEYVDKDQISDLFESYYRKINSKGGEDISIQAEKILSIFSTMVFNSGVSAEGSNDFASFQTGSIKYDIKNVTVYYGFEEGQEYPYEESEIVLTFADENYQESANLELSPVVTSLPLPKKYDSIETFAKILEDKLFTSVSIGQLSSFLDLYEQYKILLEGSTPEEVMENKDFLNNLKSFVPVDEILPVE